MWKQSGWWAGVCALAFFSGGLSFAAEADPMVQRLQALEESFSRFRAERANFEQQISQKEAALKTSEEALARSLATERAASKVAQRAEAQRDEEIKRSASLRAEILEWQKKLAASESQCEALRLELKNTAKALKGETSGLLQQVESLTRAKNESAARVSETEARLQEQSGRADRAEKELKSLSALRAEVKAADRLRDRNTELQGEVQRLKADLGNRGAAAALPPDILRELDQLRARCAAFERGEKPPPLTSGRAPAVPGAGEPSAALSPRDTMLQKARRLRDEGKVEKAADVFAGWLKEHTDDISCALELAEMRQRAGDAAGARNELLALTIRAPKNPDVFLALGRLEADENRRDNAVTALQHAIELAPQHSVALKELALLLNEMNHTEEAIPLLRRAIEAHPEDGEAHFNLAAVLLMSQPPDFREAEKMYRKALKLGEERDEKIEHMLQMQPR